MGRIKVKPVWGDVKPTEVIGYKIVVCPKTYSETCWDFLILLPSGDEEVEDIATISQICEMALKVTDTFGIYRMVGEEQEEYAMMPVLWMGPKGDEEPTWLVPPLELFH